MIMKHADLVKPIKLHAQQPVLHIQSVDTQKKQWLESRTQQLQAFHPDN